MHLSNGFISRAGHSLKPSFTHIHTHPPLNEPEGLGGKEREEGRIKKEAGVCNIPQPGKKIQNTLPCLQSELKLAAKGNDS